MNQNIRVPVNGGGHGNEQKLDIEGAVHQRYGQAANQGEAGLCVPTSYNQVLLEAIPEEILEKDFGCGDPSRYVREGEIVSTAQGCNMCWGNVVRDPLQVDCRFESRSCDERFLLEVVNAQESRP